MHTPHTTFDSVTARWCKLTAARRASGEQLWLSICRALTYIYGIPTSKSSRGSTVEHTPQPLIRELVMWVELVAQRSEAR